MSSPVTIRIESAGQPAAECEILQPVGEEVSELVLAQEGSSDTTMTISVEGRDEVLRIAASGQNAFLGLDGPDGILQYRRDELEVSAPASMVIGGQPTEIDAGYVWPLTSAAEVAQSWVVDPRGELPGTWERR